LVGVDICTRRMRRASERGYAQLLRANLLTGLPFRDASFDAVICEQVLEHFPADELERILSEMFRVLKPGGAAFIGTPVFPRPALWLLPVGLALGRWMRRGLRDAPSTHEQHLTLSDWKCWLERSGLVVERARGFRLFSLPRDGLEDRAWYYRFQQTLGRRIPSLCVEANVLARRPWPLTHGKG